jgi:DNA-binding LacI/PurR family transcriptional regulator
MKLEDVARQARVSPSTVSRVLSKTGRVSESTRARVLKIAAALHYRPDVHAQTLAGGKSRTLGLIVSNLQNPFFLDIFQVMEAEAHRYGFEVIVANTDYHPRQLVSATHWMLGRRIAGLGLVVSEKEPALIAELMEAGIPVAFYDVGSPGKQVTNIRTNYYRGTQRVVEYLHSLGHRRMAFIGHHAGLQPLHDRKRSFVKAVGRFSDEVKSVVCAGSDSPDGGQQAARQLLESGFSPTAIICVNDFMALGVLRALREHNLAVPEDVSVVGYDNIRLSEFTFPSLTTVNVPRDQIGRTVCTAILPGRGAAPGAQREYVIEPELIIRDSTGAVSRERARRGTSSGRSGAAPGR